MKKISMLFGLLLLAAVTFAQAPQAFKYQAVARNASGEPLENQEISVLISILAGNLSGTMVYSEKHLTTTNSLGLFDLEIGNPDEVLSGIFSEINWGTGSYFLKLEVDENGGSNYQLMGVSQLLSVPYSLYAKTAGNGFSGDYNDLINKPALWDSTWTTIKNKPTTITGYGITDAMTTTHVANGISSGNISDWNNAFNWGNHANAGYLTSFTETDPIFGVHPASGISSGNISDWNSAYSWGNHASFGYLTSFTETDPIFGVHPASGITSGNISDWNTAFNWGNHAMAGYLTSFTETDPIFGVHPASGITSGNISDWNTAFNWGNHASAGYLTSFTETDPIFGAWDKSTGINITSSQVSDFEESVTNTPAVLANSAKISYPPEDAAKLAGIEAGAEVNVNADWNATTGDAQILNKPIGTNPGDMLYWDGAQWIPVPVGNNDQVLKLNNAVPTWSSAIQMPTVKTSIKSIRGTSALCGCNISDGGSPVTENGICWSTVPNPTISDNKTMEGGGSGIFISSINGLLPSTVYFVRAYATNSLGISYGDELQFETLSVPIVITTLATSISALRCATGGEVTDQGSSPILSRGVCYSTIDTPTIDDSVVLSGNGTGIYTSTLTHLLPSTVYYARSYATNSTDTSYGEQISFMTISANIGMQDGGGIIFYLDETGKHGLISATNDQSSNAPWGCQGTIIGGTSYNLGTGQANTLKILSTCTTTGIAARICNDLLLNGYDDWFLPSKEELYKMFNSGVISGLSGYHWSSSEDCCDNAYRYAWLVYGATSSTWGNKDYTTYKLRAIRAF